MQTLQINSTLQGGKYTIKKVLGQGGFGITYLAEHNLLGTKVAIKEFFMKELNSRDESTSQVSVGSEGSRELVMRFRDKFIKEARNIARLNHPNIIRIHDVFEENGTAYYIMEYCNGESLNELLKMHPAGLGEAMAIKYIRQVASALQYIHERKMNHLDVKPANIMLNAGNAVLIDFGMSKQYDSTGSQTSTTPVGISHGFAPLEQYKQGGVSEFSPATDIYSLGATLYKLITGQTPPDAQTLIDEDLPTINATASVAIAIRQAMQVKRSNRPQSIAAWLQLLDSSAESSIDDESTQVFQSAWQEEEERRRRAQAEKERKEKEEAEHRQREDEERNRRIAEERTARQAADKRHAEEVAKKKDKPSEYSGDQSSKKTSYKWAIGIIALMSIAFFAISTRDIEADVFVQSFYKEGDHSRAFEYTDPYSTKRIEFTGARIYVDGKDTGMETPAKIQMSEGLHQIRIVHPDYEEAVREIHCNTPSLGYSGWWDTHVLGSHTSQTCSIVSNYKLKWQDAGSAMVHFYDTGSLSQAVIESLGFRQKGPLLYHEKKIKKRTTETGKVEYRVEEYNNLDGLVVEMGNYNFYGYHFNAKIKGQDEYLNIN